MRNSGTKTLQIHARWDDEAGVWYAFSDDIAGLAIEAKTHRALTEDLKALIPELWELNHAGREIAPVELVFGGSQMLELSFR